MHNQAKRGKASWTYDYLHAGSNASSHPTNRACIAPIRVWDHQTQFPRSLVADALLLYITTHALTSPSSVNALDPPTGQHASRHSMSYHSRTHSSSDPLPSQRLGLLPSCRRAQILPGIWTTAHSGISCPVSSRRSRIFPKKDWRACRKSNSTVRPFQTIDRRPVVHSPIPLAPSSKMHNFSIMSSLVLAQRMPLP